MKVYSDLVNKLLLMVIMEEDEEEKHLPDQ